MKKALILLLTAPLVSQTALAFVGLDPAYSGSDYGTTLSPKEFDLGQDEGISLYPSLGIGATYDDNIYRAEVDPHASMRYNLLPNIEARYEKGANSIRGGYKGNYGWYTDSPYNEDDDYKDHNVYIGAFHDGRRTSFNVYADYMKGHTPRGADNFDQPDKWDQQSVLGWVDFGATDSRLRLRLTGVGKNREYERDKAQDLTNKGLGAVLGLRVGSKTRLVLDGGWMDFNYQNSNRDAQRDYLRGGISWEATKKTLGIITIGKERYRPDNEGQPVESDKPGTSQGVVQSNDTTSWKAEIHWAATRRDNFIVESSRNTVESFGIGSNRVAQRTWLNWGHSWSEKLNSALGYSFGNDEYIGDPRKDDVMLANLSLTYRFRPRHLFRGGWIYEQRDSNIPLESYDRNRYTLMYVYDY